MTTKAQASSILAEDPRIKRWGALEPDPDGRCVVYWMQRAQRACDNPALNLAIDLGNTWKLPVICVFGLTADYPGAQRRHYRFMLEGLEETAERLRSRGVPFVVRLGSPAEIVARAAAEWRPRIVIGDENPVRIGRVWREEAARRLRVPLVTVDADVIVPSSLFPKEEYAARTIRPKIHRVWKTYLKPLDEPRAETQWTGAELPASEVLDVDRLLERLKVGGVPEVRGYLGGTTEALRRLDRFVRERLDRYETERNEPEPYMTSELSAHLHFGQISPLTIALRVLNSEGDPASVEAFLEELIVRRELAINFVARNPRYDELAGCPNWAIETLRKHARDPRPHLYSAEQLERGETHDPLWNAAQKEMVITGRMHNYLRMYWAKKILEWSPDAETAFGIALDLNDRYEMDGRDPNGYTGVAWAIGGKHDRPWPERPIFGTVRFMSYESTRRKFDSAVYIKRVRELEAGQNRLFE
jgi:deoxyribodipyrimidine photo-lyase